MRLRLLVVLLVTVALLTPGIPGTRGAFAQTEAEPRLTLTPRYPAYAGSQTTLEVNLRLDGSAVPSAPVRLQRYYDGAWQPVATVRTDDGGAGTVRVTLWRDAALNTFRAVYDGDEGVGTVWSGSVRAPLRKRTGVVTLTGPEALAAGRSGRLRIAWRTGGGDPVNGPARIDVRRPGRAWTLARRVALGADGTATITIKPSTATRWRAVAPGLDWVAGDTSRVLAIALEAPGSAVRLPGAAPKPTRLPDQPVAVGQGPNAVVTAIPNGVWRSMVGRTWHRGCPVGRAGLRLVRVNYWDYSGWRRRGEMVVAAGAASRSAQVLAALYRKKVPFRSMYRVDRFGWSPRVSGGNDYASMRAGNSSGFNCRDVVGRPGIRSPHSWGRSLDLNTWENPYHSARGWVPNSWWARRSHPQVAWRSRSHTVVATLATHGFRWTYGTEDSQHFDLGDAHGRVHIHPDCEGVVCD